MGYFEDNSEENGANNLRMSESLRPDGTGYLPLIIYSLLSEQNLLTMKSVLPVRAGLFLLLACLTCLRTAAQDAPDKLRFEYGDIVLGTGVTQPRLSWQLTSGQKGAAQTACQILVASSADVLGQQKGDVWDSGKVGSSQSVYADYAGKATPANAGQTASVDGKRLKTNTITLAADTYRFEIRQVGRPAGQPNRA